TQTDRLFVEVNADELHVRLLLWKQRSQNHLFTTSQRTTGRGVASTSEFGLPPTASSRVRLRLTVKHRGMLRDGAGTARTCSGLLPTAYSLPPLPAYACG